MIDYQFGYRGSRPPVKLVWYDGQKNGVQNAPSLEITDGVEMVAKGRKGYGSVLIGDKGRMFFSRSGTGMAAAQQGHEPVHQRW